MSDDAGGTSIKLFGVFMLARAVGFVGLVYFTNVIPRAQLGSYFLFYTVVQVSSLVSNLGLKEALVARIGEGERPNQVFTASLVVVAVAAALVALVVYALRDPIAAFVRADVPNLIVLATATWLFADMHRSGLQAEDRVLASGLLQLFQDVVRVGAGAFFITQGHGPVGLMYGVILGFAATIVVGHAAIHLELTLPKPADFRRLYSVSKYTLVFGPTNFAYFWLDTAMIGALVGPAAVSSYEVAWQTTRTLIIATTAINTTLFPKVARWASEDRFDRIGGATSGAILFTLFFPIPGLVGLAVLGTDVLSVIYRPSYADAALPMVFLAGYMVVEAVQRVGSSVLTGMDRADVPFRGRLVGVTAVAVLNVVLIMELGILGAAIATFVAKLVDTAIQWVSLRRIVSFGVPAWSLAWLTASALVMGGVVYGLTTVLAPDTLPRLFLAVGVGAVTYGVLVLRDPEIRNVVEEYVPVPLPV